MQSMVEDSMKDVKAQKTSQEDIKKDFRELK